MWWRRTATGTALTCLVVAAIPMMWFVDQRSPGVVTGMSYPAPEAPYPTHASPSPSLTPDVTFKGVEPRIRSDADTGSGSGSAGGTSGRSRGGAPPAPEPPGAGEILVGANVQVQTGEDWRSALDRADDTYGPLQMHRVFYPGLPQPWPGSRAEGGGLTVVVSFKAEPASVLAGRYDDELAEWFASAPRDRDVYWVYHHEPENNIEDGEFSASEYRATWRHLAALAERAGHPRLYATLVLMCWTLEPYSGRDWRDYYPGRDVIAVMGWDCYNSGGQRDGVYIDPSDRFDLAIEVSRAEGKPWGVAEMGSELVAGDDSGEQRAAWLRGIGRYLSSHAYPPLWVAYFDSTVGGDFRLLDRPSQQAWREFAESQNR